ncbi:hypothetical protein OGAPHI_005885 [Ogataea philodendri]|uniref:Uncharacterized protein n=1 Tax=Ogataea philodendri TaxID=1378263 RepID=A0A9P8NYN7_9ASCO|nr:uncharacterized protein OGAPHI_005885 [Ogataea philodendri]KAH3662633.1 hypothetical protein OGAPHI_005885 [Ogataea philodendri]
MHPLFTRASYNTSSESCEKGSRFRRTVPRNNTGSCGMIDSFDRSSCNPISWIFTPSISIAPSGSLSRYKAVMMVDFPAPVRPQIPIFSDGWISIVRSRKTSGKSGRYLKLTWSNLMAPFSGHEAGGFLLGSELNAGASCGISMAYSPTRSTLFIFCSSWPIDRDVVINCILTLTRYEMIRPEPAALILNTRPTHIMEMSRLMNTAHPCSEMANHLCKESVRKYDSFMELINFMFLRRYRSTQS